MDCRTFRKQHLAFVDDTLAGIGVVAMQRHLLECAECGRHDTRVRRALLLAHNLPTIEPSSDFAARLALRIEHEKALIAQRRDVLGHPMRDMRGPSMWTFFAAAASIVGIGYLAAATFDLRGTPRDIALAPVVASQPEMLSSGPVSDAALIASFSAGIPVWPIAYFASQAPVRFAQLTGTRR